MRSQRSKAKIKEIAQQENLSIKQVEEVAFSFFRFASTMMKDGDRENTNFNSIRLFKFGVFKVKEGKRQFLKTINEEPNKYKQRTSDNISGGTVDKGVQENMDERPF